MTDHALIEAARADGLELRSNGGRRPGRNLPGLDGDDTRRSCSRKSKSAILHFCPHLLIRRTCWPLRWSGFRSAGLPGRDERSNSESTKEIQ